jgi:hypothetical protein
MANPYRTNTTCDIYRTGNAPPAAPNVAAVPIAFHGDWEKGQSAGTRNIPALVYTHKAHMNIGVDIRDCYTGAMNNTIQDTVYIPDMNGTAYKVVFVARVNRNTPYDHYNVYLSRTPAPPWPTDNV